MWVTESAGLSRLAIVCLWIDIGATCTAGGRRLGAPGYDGGCAVVEDMKGNVMNKVLWVCLLLMSMAVIAGCDGGAVRERAGDVERIGVYDSRAIAVAFAGSEAFTRWMAGVKADREQARAVGDEKRVAEIEADVAERQKMAHKQAFSTASVDDILEQIEGQLPGIRQEAGVEVLVSKWDEEGLAKYAQAERVDVTMAMVDAFKPGEGRRRSAIEIQKHKPIALKEAEDIRD